MRARIFFALALALGTSPAFASVPPLAKFGPQAVPVLQDNAYLRQSPAPDFWTLSAFYVPQTTSSDCSAAALAMAVNALRGVPQNADQQLVTEQNLLAGVSDKAWMDKVTEDGTGVTFAETETFLRESLDTFDLQQVEVKAVQPAAADSGALAALRAALAENEASGRNVMLIYFNQGVITGDWDGPHISPIGAYDAGKDRVLVMDVDRDWYLPYWTSTETLLAALVKPIAAEHRGLAGGTGGYLLATLPDAGQ